MDGQVASGCRTNRGSESVAAEDALVIRGIRVSVTKLSCYRGGMMKGDELCIALGRRVAHAYQGFVLCGDPSQGFFRVLILDLAGHAAEHHGGAAVIDHR